MSRTSERRTAVGRARWAGALSALGTLGVLTLAATGVVPAQTGSSSAPPAGATLAVPGRANAHVSLAADGRFVAAVWSASTPAGETDIFAAVSRDAGATFAPPVRVNSVAGEAQAGGEQPPRAALTARRDLPPEIAVIWIAKGAAGTKLMTARSLDGGRSFEPSVTVPGTDVAGLRGWQAIAAGPQGRFAAAWLDHRLMAQREQAGKPHGAGHGGRHPAPEAEGGHPDGVAMAQLSELYFSFLGETPRAVTPGVCFCCKTALGVRRDGAVLLAWRHVYPGNMRDIAFTISRDRGRSFSAPVRVSEDRWSIAGCPDDGPSLALDAADRAHVIWPTVVVESGKPVKALFHAMTADGQTFTPRVRLPSLGHANHPQLTVVGDGTLMAVWDEAIDGSRQIARARGAIDAAGRVTFAREAAIPSGVYPHLAATGEGGVTAWTSGAPAASVIRVAR